jgi:hypothetical protein
VQQRAALHNLSVENQECWGRRPNQGRTISPWPEGHVMCIEERYILMAGMTCLFVLLGSALLTSWL